MMVGTRDGRRLHVQRTGEGAPVVVFEAGMGVSGNMWGAVVPAVARETSTVVYDRSGLGQSPPDSARRDLRRLRDDLTDVLDAIGPGPFVLAGHSWGGPIVRSVAAASPERIAGLVLVDQTDEGCDLFFGRAAERQTRISRFVVPALARVGLMRLAVRRIAGSLPPDAATAMRRYDGTPAAVRTQLAELQHHLEDLERLRAEPPVLPDVPVTVISGGRTNVLERRRRPELVAAHRARAEGLPQGRHVIAHRSSHYVPFTEPGLVAAEILRIVATCRAPGVTPSAD